MTREAAGASGIDGVLLDVDDTLVATRDAFRGALAAVLDRYAPGADLDAALALWRADPGGHYRAYTRGEQTFRQQRMTRANELHAAVGGPVLDDAAYDAWDAVFDAAFADGWAAHDDAVPALDALLAAGVRVGALTNARVGYQTDKLTRAGLADRVEVLVGVDTLGVGKPDPRVFLEGCARLGTDPARTAYVGDELDVDAAAARAAGLVGVWLDRPGPRRVPVTEADVAAAGVHVIHDLAELPTVLGVTSHP
ncbi:HAD family hydrolase [Cellulomonas iranensis]|uniref:HAD family hydrolase n=1 Tax=Cellulomonas iranensis TaxID=76862 RepID=UPI0013D849ED|nr:HAD family hydrolase [Cellulomonas iranensis]